MKKICFFKDYFCAIPQYTKEEYVTSSGAIVVKRMMFDEDAEAMQSLSPNELEGGYRQVVQQADARFGKNAPAFLYSISLNRDTYWLNSVLGSFNGFLYNTLFEQPSYISNILTWALHPSNWFLIDSPKSDYQLETEISAKFPCLVFDNVPFEKSAPPLDVNLQNIEQLIEATGVFQIWKSGRFGEGCKVTVLDTGVSDTLASRAGVTADLIDPAIGTIDTDGHGSAMIEIIKAISPKCAIRSIKVMDSPVGNDAWDIFSGISLLRHERNNIVCIALCIPDQFLRNKRGGGLSIKNSFDMVLECVSNIQNFPVCSSGNTGTANLLWPSASNHALAVGSHTKTGVRSSFSNFDHGAGNFILAPGGESDARETFGNYGSVPKKQLFGTSVSTAVTAGVSALLSEYNWFQQMNIPDRIRLFRNQCRKNTQGLPILNVSDIGSI